VNNNHYTVSERWFIQYRIATQTISNAWKVTKRYDRHFQNIPR